LGPSPCGRGVAAPPPRNTLLPTRVILPSLVVLDQTVRTLLRRSAWKFWPIASRLSRSLKVIGIDTDRSATYDLLLTFHSNHEPISYHFRDKQRFQSKIAIFSHPVYFAPPLKGFPLEFGTGALGQKTRMMGLPGRERSFTISSAVWIQYTNVTDRQTDGWTDGRRATAKTAFTHRAVKIILWLNVNATNSQSQASSFYYVKVSLVTSNVSGNLWSDIVA